MKYAGGLVKHLGLSMYRGAVPALAELISNAWDADAENVAVSIPFGVGMKDQKIVVTDNGHGMTFDEVQQAYLVVGRDRRATGGEKTPGDRPVMGRKGLGKLAGFGIARIVEVRSVRNGWLTHFRMDFDRMTKGGHSEMVDAYEPTVIADHLTKEPNGTTVTLTDLQITRSIEEGEFRASMSRRFSVLNKGFSVEINGKPIPPYQPSLQFRFEGPNSGWETVPGVGEIKWWFGFTEKPIPTESARGISILVRDKMAQAPFFFDLSGGAYGQAGMQYMTGEVSADQLDKETDFVGTDRQGILWTEPLPEALLRWGETKVREKLREWAAKRAASNEERLVQTITGTDHKVDERIAKLRPAERKEALQVIRTLASIESVTDDPKRASELLDLVLRAFEDSSFFALIKALGAVNQAERSEVFRLVTELDIFETVKLSEVVRARVAVIEKFREMIEQDVPEKPDMQEFLFKHSWLIDPEWLLVENEVALETLIIEYFGLTRTGDPDSDKRVDFFCIATRGKHLVVEVKRPSKVIGEKEVVQIINYVNFLRTQSPGEPGSPNTYVGVLVGHHLSPVGIQWRDTASKVGISVSTWPELLDVAVRIHKVFIDNVKKRIPDDSRVQDQIAGVADPAAKAKE
jgi:hypothetical protein